MDHLQRPKCSEANRVHSQGKIIGLARNGWTQKDSSFNRTETDDGDGCHVATEIITRSINKLSTNERKSGQTRPNANPTRVCLKPEAPQESKEEFARRMRQAWIDREQSKSCINIYLARNVPVQETGRPVEQGPSVASVAAVAVADEQLRRPETNNVAGGGSGRTSLKVQLQSNVQATATVVVTEAGSDELIDSAADDSGDDKLEPPLPLSAAARRVRFHKTARRQSPGDRPTMARAMSAPSDVIHRRPVPRAGANTAPPTPQGRYSAGTRRKSQDPTQAHYKFPTRKLKSGRNKAFHKSIDAPDSGAAAHKYGRKNQNHVEVVTMMSLLSPVGSDAEEKSLTGAANNVATKTGNVHNSSRCLFIFNFFLHSLRHNEQWKTAI